MIPWQTYHNRKYEELHCQYHELIKQQSSIVSCIVGTGVFYYCILCGLKGCVASTAHDKEEAKGFLDESSERASKCLGELKDILMGTDDDQED